MLKWHKHRLLNNAAGVVYSVRDDVRSEGKRSVIDLTIIRGFILVLVLFIGLTINGFISIQSL